MGSLHRFILSQLHKTQGKYSPVLLNGSNLGPRAHICAFFNNPDEEYRTLLPFIREGLDNGEKAFHTVAPSRREDHLRRLAAGGLDASELWGLPTTPFFRASI